LKHAVVVALVLVGCAKEEARSPSPAVRALQEGCPGPVPQPSGAVCTEKGCESGLVLVFQPKAPWPAGAYRFLFDLDGRRVTCTGRLPLQGCAHRNALCDGADVALAESGCDLPAVSHSFWSASFQGYPREVEASAFLDGKPIGKAALKPKYERSQPNGPGCEPTCCAASAELQLALP
jgi:hypothetical protein